jgi:hypothetical protein
MGRGCLAPGCVRRLHLQPCEGGTGALASTACGNELMRRRIGDAERFGRKTTQQVACSEAFSALRGRFAIAGAGAQCGQMSF